MASDRRTESGDPLPELQSGKAFASFTEKYVFFSAVEALFSRISIISLLGQESDSSMFAASSSSSSRSFDVKAIIIIACSVVLAVTLCVLAGVLFSSWIVLVSMFLFLLSPIPYFTCGKRKGDFLAEDKETGANHLGFFLSSTMATFALGLPAILIHVNQLAMTAGFLVIVAGALLYGSVIMLEIIRQRRKADAAF